MRQRIISAIVYAITSLSMGAFFDGLYGGEPIVRYQVQIKMATGALFLFVIACVVSLFRRRAGAAIGLAAALSAWPYFRLKIRAIPWTDLAWYARYRPDTAAALICLTGATIYSSWALYKRDGRLERRTEEK